MLVHLAVYIRRAAKECVVPDGVGNNPGVGTV